MAIQPLYYQCQAPLMHHATIVEMGTSQIKSSFVHWIRLDQTIFHPQGGGQPSDEGTIDGVKVDLITKQLTGAKRTDFVVHHCFFDAPPFLVGQKVELRVDEEARGLHARLHSAGHLLGHIVETEYPLSQVIGAQHFPHNAQMTFKGLFPKDAIAVQQRIEQLLKEAIATEAPVYTSYKEEDERLVHMGDYPAVPCGGTHVRNVGELLWTTISNIKVTPRGMVLKYEIG